MPSLLCLDPSSTTCGLCYWPEIDGLHPVPTVLHVIRPKANLKAISRIDLIVAGVIRWTMKLRPSVVAMEYTSGKLDVRRARQRGRPVAGLAVLGQAQGEIRRALLELRTPYGMPPSVETVDESVWTNRVPKNERALRIAAEFPIYAEFLRAGHDGGWKGDPRRKWDGKGLDAADSFGIGLWYIGQRNTKALMDSIR